MTHVTFHLMSGKNLDVSSVEDATVLNILRQFNSVKQPRTLEFANTLGDTISVDVRSIEAITCKTAAA